MELRNYICWNPRNVHQIIKIDAEAVKDNVFRAVHTPQPILMSTTTAENLKPATDESFLEAFTNPDIPEIFSLVLGDSGAGKTHFIHWLRLHVPAGENVRVVNIPKVGTSLRSIVELIIHQLPGESRGQYLHKLSRVGGDTQTEEQLQEKLLNALAMAVSAEYRRGVEKDSERDAILAGLIPLFQDPHVRRKWFLADGKDTIIKELTRHVYASNEKYSRLERDRQFSASDLNVQGIQISDVSKDTRDILEAFKYNRDYMQLAADITNQCLDAAIGEALSFSGQDLVTLVAEVRKHLYRQGLSLVIFIEDLSRMQGVDKALLDALTTPSEQGDQKLCTIRWAAAMTTGYYDRLEATIGTRINLMGKVVADPGTWESPEATDHLALFMGRYLNAVRLGMDELESWDHSQPVPNACETCERRTCCHEAFGTGGDFGMYPFTPKAMWNMAVRSSRENEDWFNPRRLLKMIVTPMLANYGPDIVDGRFPSQSMINDMGGERLEAPEKVELLQIAGADAGRHLALQELWQTTSKIVPFSDGLLKAFNLTQLRGRTHDSVPSAATKPNSSAGVTTASRPQAMATATTTTTPAPPVQIVADPIFEKLRDWGNRQSMDDKVAQDIRLLVFDALVSHIDWDRAGVARGPYVGQSKPFNHLSIVFRGQLTRSRAQLQLSLPLQEDEISYSRAAMALQGLYLFSKHGHWGFEDGPRYLVNVQSCLEEWAASAVKMVRDFAPNDEKWNAIDAATELLAVGAALTGNITTTTASADIWSALWGNAPEHAHLRLMSKEMRSLANAIVKDWSVLQGHVRYRATGTKNSALGNFLNPRKSMCALTRLKRNTWRLSMSPGVDDAMYKDFNVIAKLYVKVAQELKPALEAEAEQYRQWLGEMDTHWGDSISKTEIVETFNALQDALNDGGILKNVRDAFQTVLNEFAGANYLDARKRAGLVVGTEANKLEPHLFAKNGVVDAMCKGNSLVEEAGKYLDFLEKYHRERLNELEGSSGESLNVCWNEIDVALQSLDSILGDLAKSDESGSYE